MPDGQTASTMRCSATMPGSSRPMVLSANMRARSGRLGLSRIGVERLVCGLTCDARSAASCGAVASVCAMDCSPSSTVPQPGTAPRRQHFRDVGQQGCKLGAVERCRTGAAFRAGHQCDGKQRPEAGAGCLGSRLGAGLNTRSSLSGMLGSACFTSVAHLSSVTPRSAFAKAAIQRIEFGHGFVHGNTPTRQRSGPGCTVQHQRTLPKGHSASAASSASSSGSSFITLNEVPAIFIEVAEERVHHAWNNLGLDAESRGGSVDAQ